MEARITVPLTQASGGLFRAVRRKAKYLRTRPRQAQAATDWLSVYLGLYTASTWPPRASVTFVMVPGSKVWATREDGE